MGKKNPKPQYPELTDKIQFFFADPDRLATFNEGMRVAMAEAAQNTDLGPYLGAFMHLLYLTSRREQELRMQLKTPDTEDIMEAFQGLPHLVTNS